MLACHVHVSYFCHLLVVLFTVSPLVDDAFGVVFAGYIFFNVNLPAFLSQWADESEVFRVKKSNHSKKIVKQLKREYKEDLEKCGTVKHEIRSGKISHCPLQLPVISVVTCGL